MHESDQEIYNKGGRKFAFLSLSPIGYLPWVRASDSSSIYSFVEELIQIAKQQNRELSQVLRRLERNLKGFKHSTHDFYTSLSERSEYPSKYGN